jgi:hypothetical protein
VFLLPYRPAGSGHPAAGFFFFNASPTARVQSLPAATCLLSGPVGLGLSSDIRFPFQRKHTGKVPERTQAFSFSYEKAFLSAIVRRAHIGETGGRRY